MSASPADGIPGQTPGQTPGRTPGQTPGRTPNGGIPLKRRPERADPLVRPKSKTKRPPRPPTTNGSSGPLLNGSQIPGHGQTQAMPPHPGRSQPPVPRIPTQPPSMTGEPDPVSGFTSPAIASYTDYPLVMTKRSIMEGLRHHVARFVSKKIIDPRDTNQFTHPVRLHRRDPRAPAFGNGGTKEGDADVGGDAVDDKERERLEILKAEREAYRAAEMAQVAPLASGGGNKRLNFKKKTQQIFRNDQTDEQKAESKLRYEEALPWHLEDFDGKQIWVGSYEAALSDTYAALVQMKDGTFRMIPLQKWYRFTPKNQFKTLTIEEAEMRMGQKVKDPRWFMDSQQATRDKQNEQENKKAARGLFLGKWERDAGGGGSSAPKTKHEQADADDLDFEEDRFADDEENVLFEGEDEETKQAEERIKRDQLQANVFDLKDEKEYEKAEQDEKKEKDAEKRLGKGVKKALMRREKNYIYDSDSADNPYSEESESDDTETERLKELERIKEGEKKPNPSDPEKGKATSKPSGSGTSSRGTNTPSNRPSKHLDSLKKTSSSNLKRPGSPNLSEASGTESSRKKAKKQHPLTSTSQTLNSSSKSTSSLGVPSSSAPAATLDPARPTLTNSRKSSNTRVPTDAPKVKAPDSTPSTGRLDGKRPHSRAGSGSEGEAAGSGGEKSDGARKKLKLNFGKAVSKTGSVPTSQAGSVPASRAGSPEIRGSEATSKPGPPPSQAPPANPAEAPFPTAAELRAHIPPQGIKVGDLLAHFKGQVLGEERKTRFTKLMRENSRYDKVAKLLKPME